MLIITMGSISRKLCVRLFTLCKISTAILRILWRHLQTDLRNVYCLAKYIYSCNRCRKQRSNRCLIGSSSNWYEIDQKRGSKFGALLWRHLTPQRKTAIQVHNYSPSCIQLFKKIWENLPPVGLLVRTNLFIPSRFFGHYCCLRYIAKFAKEFM